MFFPLLFYFSFFVSFIYSLFYFYFSLFLLVYYNSKTKDEGRNKRKAPLTFPGTGRYCWSLCFVTDVRAKFAKDGQLSKAEATVLAQDRCNASPASAHTNTVIIGMMKRKILFPWRVVRGLKCVQ